VRKIQGLCILQLKIIGGHKMNDLMVLENVKSDESRFMNEIIQSRGSNLPDNIEQVLPIFEFTDLKAKAFKMLADKMNKLEAQAEISEAANRSARQWSIASLYAQKRMGEITREMPVKNSTPFTRPEVHGDRTLSVGKKESLANEGIHYKVYQDAERIAAHPEILERVIESAEKTNDIPTKAQVLNTIRAQKQKEVNARVREKSDSRIVNETTTATKDYYDSVKGFEQAIKTAILNSKVGKFAPEGLNFMIKKHDVIRNLLKELEETING
jgi:hypothetical protein